MSRLEVVLVAAFAGLVAWRAAGLVGERVGRRVIAWRGRREVDGEWAAVNGGGH